MRELVGEKKGRHSQLAHGRHTDRYTLLRGSVRGHWPLSHHMVPLVDLAHHAHWVLLSLVMLSCTTRRHVILLGGRLLVHHGSCWAPWRERKPHIHKKLSKTAIIIKKKDALQNNSQQEQGMCCGGEGSNISNRRATNESFHLDLAACSCLAGAHSFPWAAPGSCSFGSELACPVKTARCDCSHPWSRGCWGAYS